MKNLPQRRSLVKRCTSTAGPRFYRDLYNMGVNESPHRIEGEEDWLALPFLSKSAMLDVPLRDRLFAYRSDVDHLRASSGTSGKKPLLSPRTFLREMGYRSAYHDFKGAILAFTVPAMPHWHAHFQSELGHDPRVVVFDPSNVQASVRLAQLAGVDSISTFAYHIQTIGEHMIKEGCAKDIRFIEICGEACSRSLFEYIRKIFPNATILPFYGSSEVEDSPIGVPCRPITGQEPLSVYHSKESQYHELIDPDSGDVLPITSGTEGELVVTAYPGEPSAFPLIRYRTGDKVRVFDVQCPMHKKWSFTMLGRVELDFVKVPGGILRVDEVERVIRLFRDRVSDRFQIHVLHHESPKGPKMQVDIAVESTSSATLSQLAHEISKNLRVNPTLTYAEGVAAGRFLPLTCSVFEPSLGKVTRLIVH